MQITSGRSSEPNGQTRCRTMLQNRDAFALNEGGGALETPRKPGKTKEKCDETVTPTGLEPVLPP